MEPKTYIFTVGMVGTGVTIQDAWENAINGFTLDPGPLPEDYEVVEDQVTSNIVKITSQNGGDLNVLYISSTGLLTIC